jgi:zinc transport system permease protein
MNEFCQALRSTPFLQHALLAGLLVSISCGIVGTYVVVRRISYLAGGIAHCVLGGMGLAAWLNKTQGMAWLTPLEGALAAALLAALIMGVVSLRLRQREDTIISGLWAVGMATGVLFISQTPGYQQDLMSYLFGNILMVTGGNLWLIVVLDMVVISVSLLFYKQLLAVCFDEEFTRTRGIRVTGYYLLLLCLTALTVVLLVTVVGIILVIALLTLPVATAGQFVGRLWQVMLAAVLLSMMLTTTGLAVSYGPDLPAGAMTIILAAGVYLVALLGGTGLRRWRSRVSV